MGHPAHRRPAATSRTPAPVALSMAALMTIVLVLGACEGTAGPAPSSERSELNMVELGADDSGKIVELVEGESLVVRLQSNPSTGYEWEAIVDGDTVLTLAERAFADDGSDLAGAPGTEVFRFDAVSEGQATVTLSYRRPWETDVDPIETLVYTIDVGAAQ